MRPVPKTVAVLLLWCAVCTAQTNLSGDVGGMVLDQAGSPYAVDQDITVPAGKSLTIKSGTALLFGQFTGLTVEGRILVEGSPESPVVFTSSNDPKYNTRSEQLPNPFDWNGIVISRNATGVDLRHFQLLYSVFGLKAQRDDLRIEGGIFRQNGQFNFTINDKIQHVQDNMPYSYSVAPADTSRDKGKAVVISDHERAVRRHRTKVLAKNIGATVLLAGAAAGGGGGLYFLSDAGREYDMSTSDIPRSEREAHYANYEASRLNMILCLAGAGVALPAAGVLYFLKIPEPKKPRAGLKLSGRGVSLELCWTF